MTQWNAKSTTQGQSPSGQAGRQPGAGKGGGGGKGGGEGGGGKGGGGKGGGGGGGGGGAKEAMDAARELFKAKRFDEARTAFEAVLEKNANMAGAYLGIGNIHAARGEYEEAMEHYAGALHSNKEFAPALVMMGNLLVKQGDKDKALLKYKEALEINPTLAGPRLALGRILAQTGRMAEAIECLTEAVQQNPQNEEAQIALSGLYQQQGDLDKAQQMLTTVVAGHPESWQAMFKLAKLLNIRENYKDAIQHCRQAMQLKPEAPMVHQLMGQCYLNDGELDLALREFNTVVETAPTMIAAKFGLVRALMKQDKLAEARKMLVELSGGSRNLSMVHRLLAELFVAQGQYDLAVAEYKAALIHGKKLVEKYPELLDVAKTPGDDKVVAAAYGVAFSKINFDLNLSIESEGESGNADHG